MLHPARDTLKHRVERHLRQSAECGDMQGIVAALDHLVDPNAVADHSQSTALMNAAEQGRIEVLRFLLEQEGIDVQGRNANGNSALMLAANGAHVECVRALLTKHADVRARNVSAQNALDLVRVRVRGKRTPLTDRYVQVSQLLVAKMPVLPS